MSWVTPQVTAHEMYDMKTTREVRNYEYNWKSFILPPSFSIEITLNNSNMPV
jgi:hypothetical protein